MASIRLQNCMGFAMTDAIKYHEIHGDTQEIDWIEHIGYKRLFSTHGKYQGKKQILPDKEIIEILEGYIRGAKHKDWIRCGLSEGLCIKAAQDRIQILKNK